MLSFALAMMIQVAPVPDDVPNAPVGGPIADAIMERIEARMAANETTEATRYHGLRTLIEELRDRPQVDHSGLFPGIQEAIKEARAARQSTEQSVGPIREALQLLGQLVGGLSVLVVLLLIADVYRTFFRKT
jgi:hypothetical protein